MAAMLSLLVLFAAISQCKAQYYGDGDGDSPSPAPPAPGPAPSGGNYECSWWSGKCETSMFGWYTSKSKCENETSCKPSPMDSIVV